jgi:large subunit ribosomal protein L30
MKPEARALTRAASEILSVALEKGLSKEEAHGLAKRVATREGTMAARPGRGRVRAKAAAADLWESGHAKYLRITLVRSPIGSREPHRSILRDTLGLRRLNDSVLRLDNPSVRGAIAKVAYLLDVVEVAI